MKSSNYNEMEKLMMYLEVEKIPFEVKEHSLTHSVQVFYPSIKEVECDVICHEFSYGGPEGYLEIMGLLTDEEAEYDSVVGWLTAFDVFSRIYNHYYKTLKRKEEKEHKYKEEIKFITERWGKEIVKLALETNSTKMEMNEFLDHCIACGGDYSALLLSGVRKLYPKIWDAIPSNIGKDAFFTICSLLTILDISPNSSEKK